ncbi:anti-sigma factor [Cohnella candidum]|nr:anti-sigma factor [Cohnella candidum]
MNERDCGVPEERWADWHLKKLPADTAEAMARHLAVCPACRISHRQWGEWLGARDDLADGGSAFAGSPMPSERVRRSLRRAVWRSGLRTKWAGKRAEYAGAAAMVLVLAAAILLRELPRTADGEAARNETLAPVQYARLHQPEVVALMERPDTRVYSVKPAFAPEAPDSSVRKKVTVWVNGQTQEMFILFDGMLPADSRDVQAWGSVKEGFTNLGLLEFHQAQGHLYSHSQVLPQVEELAFTIEPKGGSDHPTVPETAHIRLAGEGDEAAE